MIEYGKQSVIQDIERDSVRMKNRKKQMKNWQRMRREMMQR